MSKRILTEGSTRNKVHRNEDAPPEPPAPLPIGFWYSTINLERLNNGYTIISEGVEYCLAGKKLFCRASEKEPFEACGDMKADDFIKVLILGEHKT